MIDDPQVNGRCGHKAAKILEGRIPVRISDAIKLDDPIANLEWADNGSQSREVGDLERLFKDSQMRQPDNGAKSADQKDWKNKIYGRSSEGDQSTLPARLAHQLIGCACRSLIAGIDV